MLIEELPATTQQCVKVIDQTMQEVMTANAEYRGGWPETAEELLSLGSSGPEGPDSGVRERSGEFVKLARQRANSAGVDAAAFDNDLREIMKKMEAGRDEIQELRYKKSTCCTTD